jgi:translation elongation factor EF-G
MPACAAIGAAAGGCRLQFLNKTKPTCRSGTLCRSLSRGARVAGFGRPGWLYLVDLQVSLLDATYDEEESSEMAFKVAASMALRQGLERAKPVLLEPIMKVEAVAPDEFSGSLIGDLSARGGQIEGLQPRGIGMQAVRATVPLAEMFGYATDLRSMTQGRGTFTMEFDHYARSPLTCWSGS